MNRSWGAITSVGTVSGIGPGVGGGAGRDGKGIGAGESELELGPALETGLASKLGLALAGARLMSEPWQRQGGRG